MSLFDRFVSVLKSGVSGVRPKDLEGPLGLRPGDKITHYNETFVVAGVRVLESEAANVHLYCLMDEVGRRAILSAVGGPQPEFTLQRAIEHQVRWESTQVDDFDDETYHFSGEGRCRLHTVGDAGVRGCRFVEFRLFGDEAGDQMLVLEDYAGHRETRLAEPLFDGEFEIHRAPRRSGQTSRRGTVGGVEAISEVPSGTQEIDVEALKGSPLAAAMNLAREKAEGPEDPMSESQDVWSDAYDDDGWSDDDFDDDRPARQRSEFARKQREARVIQASMPAVEETTEVEVPASVFDTAISEDPDWLGF